MVLPIGPFRRHSPRRKPTTPLKPHSNEQCVSGATGLRLLPPYTGYDRSLNKARLNTNARTLQQRHNVLQYQLEISTWLFLVFEQNTLLAGHRLNPCSWPPPLKHAPVGPHHHHHRHGKLSTQRPTLVISAQGDRHPCILLLGHCIIHPQRTLRHLGPAVQRAHLHKSSTCNLQYNRLVSMCQKSCSHLGM